MLHPAQGTTENNNQETLKALSEAVERALYLVLCARTELTTAALMQERPAVFVEIVDGIRHLLAEAEKSSQDAYHYLTLLEECSKGPDDVEIEPLTEKLENQFRGLYDECYHQLTLIAPADVHLSALQQLLHSLPKWPREDARLNEQLDHVRGNNGFELERPGETPMIDDIDPTHYFRRQVSDVKGKLSRGVPGRLQACDRDHGLDAIFFYLRPIKAGVVEIHYSFDNVTWTHLIDQPTRVETLDPVLLLAPFTIAPDTSQASTPTTNATINPAQLATVRSQGTC